MPGTRALGCSRRRARQPGARHRALAITPLNYPIQRGHDVPLWRVVQTESHWSCRKTLVVNAGNWSDVFLAFDYIGARSPREVDTPQGTYWRNRFEWAEERAEPDQS